jgi:SMODS and SLOG-associating 2TM effector domain 1
VGEPPPEGGRIGFRIRIGVTGHRDLELSDAVRAEVRAQIEWIQDAFLPDSATAVTPVRLAVVTQLADGVDRSVPKEAMWHAAQREQTAHLEVILPMREDEYIATQKFSDTSEAEFRELCGAATWVSTPSVMDEIPDDEAYESSAWKLIRHCDVLLSVWRGTEPRRKGGTAETLLHAAWCGKPCIWIRPSDPPDVIDNFRVETPVQFYQHVLCVAGGDELGDPPYCRHIPDVLAPLRHSHDGLEKFNREGLPGDFETTLVRQLEENPDREWVAASHLRASALARRNRSRFWQLATAISILATMAALALGLSLSFWHGHAAGHDAALAEALFLAAALAVLFAVRRLKYHRRWLSYRVLAERLRSAGYLAPIGTDVRRTAGLQRVYVEHQPEDWLHRAFLEVWDRRPRRSAPTSAEEADLGELRWRLAEKWLGEQIRFYRRRGPRNLRSERILSGVVLATFVLAMLVAVLHWRHIAEKWPILLSVVLPALGTSVGAIVTIAQYRALAERYDRVAAELAFHQARIHEAVSLNALSSASFEAARTIAEETGDWFGAMWFLDVEHL